MFIPPRRQVLPAPAITVTPLWLPLLDGQPACVCVNYSRRDGAGGGVVILKAGGWQSTVGLWFWSLTKGWRGQNGTGFKKDKKRGRFQSDKTTARKKKKEIPIILVVF